MINVLITGANTGIGFETAKALALTSTYNVYCGCRSVQKGQETVAALKRATNNANNIFFTTPIDLGSLESVKTFGEEFSKQVPELHVLVCNAGIMGVPEFRKTVDGLESHFAVNHLGHFLLIQLLMPNLYRAAEVSRVPSRIVNVSSDAHLWGKMIWENVPPSEEFPYDSQKAYGNSKLCNVLLTRELNRRFHEQDSANPRIVAFSLHPGVVQTELVREMGFTGTFATYALKFLRFVKPSSPWAMKTPAEGALTTLCCIRDAPVGALPEKHYSNFYRDQAKVNKMKSTTSSPQDARRLWSISMELVHKSKL